MTGSELRVQLLEPPTHSECGPQRTGRVVLVRDGDAESRHHRVADELLDRSAFGFDLVAHRVRERLEDVLQVLGVELFSERRRPGEIREEHGDELPFRLVLVFERGPAPRTELRVRR